MFNIARGYIIYICRPNNRPSKYMKQKSTELKGEIDHPTIIVGDFKTPLSAMME